MGFLYINHFRMIEISGLCLRSIRKFGIMKRLRRNEAKYEWEYEG